ncbi:3933_t:CDS:2, partial [Scutellospora calospora]
EVKTSLRILISLVQKKPPIKKSQNIITIISDTEIEMQIKEIEEQKIKLKEREVAIREKEIELRRKEAEIEALELANKKMRNELNNIV